MLSSGQSDALRILHYAFPALMIFYYVVVQCMVAFTLGKAQSKRRESQRSLIIVLQVVVLILYSIEALMLVVDAFANDAHNSTQDGNIYALLEIFIWTVLNASLIEAGDIVSWSPLYGCWCLDILAEIVLCGLNLPVTRPGAFNYFRLTIQILRLIVLALLPISFFHPKLLATDRTDIESEPLLKSQGSSDQSVAKTGVRYGSTPATVTSSEESVDEDDGDFYIGYRKAKNQFQQRLQASGSWLVYVKRYRVFVPLIWPTGQRRTQISIVCVGVLLCADRALTLLLPRQLGLVVNAVSHAITHGTRLPAVELVLFLLYQYLSASRILDSLEEICWTPVEQHAEKNVKLAAHAKIMDLSRDFQTEKSSAEMLDSVNQGLSVTRLFREVVISIVPLAIDLLIAAIYLSSVFGCYIVMMFAATAIVYLWSTIRLERERTKTQRTMLESHRMESRALYESVGEWDTVSYFGRRAYEKNRLGGCMNARLAAELKLTWFDAITNLLKEFVVQLCLAGACLLVFYQIMQGLQPIGSFVMLVYYFQSVMGYIKYLGYLRYYLSRCLVNAELLCDLLLREASIQDGPSQFNLVRGTVAFENVNFSYDLTRKILHNFTFHAPGSTKIALVGETGSGKSTILRLLFRFYDVQQGRILVDGQDIREVSLDSFRQHLGVVPQDPSLFNISIMDNVRYARLDATDDEVIEACRSAAIHEQIMTYTNGYQTKVGEHGVILSGGEKQRIAIARVILKNAKIILLDEATSSVDSETEHLIQASLGRLTAGKTTFTIAHRLSTVKDADVILVIKNGAIVEQGSPSELLAKEGKFSRLWRGQFNVQRDSTPATKRVTAKKSVDAVQQNKSSEGRHHGRERSGSSFRADAPVFVPNYQRGTEASASSIPSEDKKTSHQCSHDDGPKQPSGHDGAGGKHVLNIALRRQDAQPRPVEIRAPPNDLAPEAHHDGSADVSQAEDGPKWRTPRLNRRQRRQQSRSEGSGTAIKGEMDGASDGCMAKGTTPGQGKRNVSGPSQYPSGATIIAVDPVDVVLQQEPSQQHPPRRRRRHIRFRKQPENSGALSGSLSTSGDTMVDDAIQPPQILAQTDKRNFTSPNVASNGIASAMTPGQARGHVKFASET